MSRRTPTVALAAAGALVVGLLGAAPASATAAEPSTTTINGYRNVGYYGQWQATGAAGATLKKLFVDADAGANLTHLNYSFGNIAGSQGDIDAAIADGTQGLDDTAPYTCFISDQPAPAPGQTQTAGDADSDFLHRYSADESVLGVADTATQKLAGNLNQLRQLKRLYPQLKVHVSLGGWSWSKSFSPAVATPERREALAESCIDLWIHGNLPEIDGRGGDGAAAGIFDGFDLDWEWPGAPDWAQEVGNAVDPENDRANFLAFVKELHDQLAELTVDTGRDYELSAFLPASPGVITAGGWNDPALWEYLDFGNLQGYDLWGSWGATTGHQGNVYGDPAYNWGLGLDTVLASYTSAGVDPSQLNLGLAAYGHGWRGADLEPWQPADSPAWGEDGAATLSWDKLKLKALDIHHNYTADGHFNATYGYDPETREWWTFDDPIAVAEKTRWALAQGLGGVDFWELAHDVTAELPAVSARELRRAERGPLAGDELTACADAEPWRATTTYRGGETVFLDGRVFRAQWWTRGAEPGRSAYGSWETVTACGVDAGALQQWYHDTVYDTGDQVIHEGVTYTAQWWTRGQEPGASKWGPWRR